MTHTELWSRDEQEPWRRALADYPGVIGHQGVARLPELDAWYHDELARALQSRTPAHLELAELVRLTEWKMARGVWRAPNLVRVRSNDPAQVVLASTEAFAKVPHPTAPISILARLDGVGPATASAAAAALAPDVYPFFDELVAAQVPGLGPVAWTLGYYSRYALALRERAGRLGSGWTPDMVQRALWSHVGGKAGAA